MDPELYRAARSGDISYVETNICGEDLTLLSETTPNKNTVLHVAAEFKQTNFMKEVGLKCHPALIWQQNSKGDTPLHVAARVGCFEIVDLLIERALSSSVDIESREESQEIGKEQIGKVNGEMDTALHCAVRNGHYEVVKSLIVAYPELSSFVNNADESPLYLAVLYNSPKIAMLILDSCQSSFSYNGTNKVTALHLLSISCHKQAQTPIVKKLIEQRPQITREKDIVGWSPLHYAAVWGNTEAVTTLLEYDSSAVYLVDQDGDSALHIAAFLGRINVIEELIKCRPDVFYLTNEKVQTALHVAVAGRQESVVRYILGNPRLVGLLNEADKEGNTALHLAVLSEAYNIITMLARDNRVKLTVINKELKTALEIYRNFRRNGFKAEKVEYLFKDIHRTQLVQWTRNYIKTQLKGTHEVSPPTSEAVKNPGNVWFEVYLLVAMLITTVSFAAAFTMPGGHNDDGPDKGMPIFKDKPAFKAFVVSDALAFAFSLGAVYFHLRSAPSERTRARYNGLQNHLMVNAILALGIAFASAMYIVLTKSSGLGWTAFIIIGCLFLVYQVCWFVDPYAKPLTKALKPAHRQARNLLYRFGII